MAGLARLSRASLLLLPVASGVSGKVSGKTARDRLERHMEILRPFEGTLQVPVHNNQKKTSWPLSRPATCSYWMKDSKFLQRADADEASKQGLGGQSSIGPSAGSTEPMREPATHRKVVVFFHGLGCSKYDFAGAVHQLDSSWTIIALDWPRTQDDDRANFTFEDLAEYAHAAVHQLLERDFKEAQGGHNFRYVLVGHSMGAKIAVQYATKFRDEIAALVNVEGHLHASDPRMAEAIVKEFEGYGGDARVGLQEFLARQRNMPAELQDIEEDDPARAKWLQTVQNYTPAAIFLSQARAIVHSQKDVAAPDLWQYFLALARGTAAQPAKVTYIFGERTKEKLHESLSVLRGEEDIEVVEIPDAGHFPFFDNPAHFWRELNKVLAEAGRSMQGPE